MLPIAGGEILVRTACASSDGSDWHSAFFDVPPQPGAAGCPGTRARARWWIRAAQASSRTTAC